MGTCKDSENRFEVEKYLANVMLNRASLRFYRARRLRLFEGSCFHWYFEDKSKSIIVTDQPNQIFPVLPEINLFQVTVCLCCIILADMG